MMSRLKSRFVNVTKQFREWSPSRPLSRPPFPARRILFACRCARWSSAFYIILISPDSCVSKKGKPFCGHGLLCVWMASAICFPHARIKESIMSGYRGPSRGTEWPSIYSGYVGAHRLWQLGCGRLKRMQIARSVIFRRYLAFTRQVRRPRFINVPYLLRELRGCRYLNITHTISLGD